MEIGELTINQLKEIRELCIPGIGGPFLDAGPWVIGEKYLIRTVTFILTGRLKSVSRQELELDNAAWIADTGRFHKALAGEICNLSESEIEPYPGTAIVGRGAVVDAAVYCGELPSEVK